ncbi:BadF/BadG/BcrA/BcrD ATPase family protein [Nonomuraea typhae]|uniref:BadF/BadG/BcrA/BcrD ATPase family protein n=1 Tax=Nonomuraea typhae TaxID=2603600 RepID=UPI0012F788BF|nr:BadF/BadG/BcrA/BcrD ATPase family protein [Nonomuraea typhae]
MDVAIDGGQTGLRLALAAEGRVLEVRETAGLSYAEGSPVSAVLSRLELPSSGVDTICLGLTTVLDDPGTLIERLLKTARRVILTSDVVTSHAGAFPSGTSPSDTSPYHTSPSDTSPSDTSPSDSSPSGTRPSGAGVVLAAGTGAIALGIPPGGPPVQVDGWGYLCGDAGGGHWIGRHGLDAAYRGFDGRAEPGPLTTRAREVFGDLATLPERLYLAPDAVARIARFAPRVLDLAAHDPAAREIVTSAATELAATVTAAARHFTGDVPVAWTGRLLRDSRLRTAFEAAVASCLPQARIQQAPGDSLSGAARLAAAPDLGPYASLARVARA